MSTTKTPSFISAWAKSQQPKARKMKTASVFYRNLEEELDVTRAQQNCAMLHHKDVPSDFASCDVLAFGTSGLLRKAFLEELAKYPDFQLGSHGSRLLDGNSDYIEKLERDVANYHGAEEALIVTSGGVANEAIFETIPRPGDAVVYDELIHTSIHEGLKHSLVMCKKAFRHNDVDSFIEVLTDVRNSQPQIRSGKRSVIVSVESFYSMDGDVCPLPELIQAAKEIFPEGQAQFIIDEAHSSGTLGPNGAGFVSALGLEKEVAVRMHTFGKALSSSGGVILCNATVKKMLINTAKTVICSIAPSFTLLAGARAGYDLLKSEYGEKARQRLQHNTKFFLEELHSNPIWEEASDAGILRMPLFEEESWESQRFVTHICPVWTPRPKNNFWLSFHLQLAGYAAYPVYFPIVPKQQERVRLVIHAGNTEEEIRGLVASICSFGKEMLEIEESGDKNRIPNAARYANGLYAKEEMNIQSDISAP